MRGVVYNVTHLVEGPREERGEGGGEDDGAVAARGSRRHSHQVLFRDEALHIPVGTHILR